MRRAVPWRFLSLLLLFLAATGSVCRAQRHLPDYHIFDTVETVRLDAVVEQPAVDNGVAVADVPRPGENLSFQVFVPRAGGQTAFSCDVELDNPNGALTRTFRIASVRDWLGRDLKPLASKDKLIFYIARLSPTVLPVTGHIATVVLAPLGDVKSPLPIKITCSITIVSTPPRRVWQMRGTQQLTWR